MDDRAVRTYSIDNMYLIEETQKNETQEKAQAVEARRWDDRSSWAWTGKLEEYTHTKLSVRAVATPGLRQEMQQTLKSWETEDQEWS